MKNLSLQRLAQALRARLPQRKPCAGAGWTGVAISGNTLLGVSVAAPAHKGNAPIVLKSGMVDLDAHDNQMTAAALAALATQIAVPRSPWVLLLPRDDYRLLVLPEPAVPAAEMLQSLRWQLAPLLDFAIEEAVVEHLCIPTLNWQPEKKQDLYAIAARRPLMEQYAELFREARLQLSAIDIGETAQRNIASLSEQGDEGLGMVSFNEQHVQITFSWKGELYLDRLIAEPLHSMAESTDRRNAACLRITMQIQRSVDALHQHFSFIPLRQLLVAGAPPEFSEQLQASIAQSVATLSLASLFDFSATPELHDPLLSMRYFSVLGAALRGIAPTP